MQKFFTSVSRYISKNDFIMLLGIFAAWRLCITWAGIVGIMMFQPIAMPPIDMSYGTFWDMWTRWDGWHYINISENGYLQPHLTAFFPLYPLLIYGLHLLLPLPAPAIGLFISHAALLGALYFIFHIAKDIFSKHIAYLTIVLLLFFPTSLFFGLVYTESLFLFFVSGTFFFIRKERFFLAFIFSFAAALTRNLGILMLIPLCFEYIERFGWRFKKHIFLLTGPALGLGAYMAYLYSKFGDPFQFVHAQSSWNRSVILNPLVIIKNQLINIFEFVKNHDVFMGIEIFVGLSFLVIIIFSMQKKYKMPKSFIAYMIVMLLPGLLQNTWASVNRYAAVIFPAFLLMALVLDERPLLKHIVIAGFSIFLGVSTILFVNFRWAG